MKISLTLAALLVFAAGARADQLQSSWNELKTDTATLDDVIAKRQLSGVHDAALNLRDSLREMRLSNDDLNEDGKPALKALIERGAALLDSMHESADDNDLRLTTQKERQVHVVLDKIAALYLITPIGPVAARGSVKDPYCRMTVDPATAPARVAVDGQTYYFCSKADANRFSKNPTPYVKLFDELTFGKPKAFTVGLNTRKEVVAGRPANLTLAIRQAGTTVVIRDFQLVHEKLMHLIVVSDDLSYFRHEHPQLGSDGRFRLNWTFPQGGRYWLYADCTPSIGTNQLLKTQVDVAGPKGTAAPKLVADTQLSRIVDGYTIAVRPKTSLKAGQSTLLTYTLSKNGVPVTDMEPYLGAMGHLMAVSQDGRNAVHTHTVSPGGAVTAAMATPTGPSFTYELNFPAPGLTKIWAQFQRAGHIITVPFTFDIAGNLPMKTTPKLVTTLATGAALAAPGLAATKTPTIPASAQKVTITLPDGYKTAAATVKAGRPVALTFLLKSEAGCGDEVVVPAAKWKKTLKVGEKATVIYTPTKVER